GKSEQLYSPYLEGDRLIVPAQIHSVDTILWEIPDFSRLPPTRLRSRSFTFGGQQWSLLLDPRVGDEKSGTYKPARVAPRLSQYTVPVACRRSFVSVLEPG